MSESLAIVPSPEMDFRERNKEEFGFPYKFSIVMAVYNVEPFLREAVDSVLAQDIGFEENVQLILVDDGSQDCSGAICDEYKEQFPNNILVIHKENGGVSSARNEGLKYAEGRYLNFMDSDDQFTSNVLSRVYSFFVEHEEETDLVTIPLDFFDAQTGAHWQNGKFKKGTRVLDLYWDYQSTIMFVNASFFVNHVKGKIDFDSHLVCGEDIKVLLTVLIDKMKLGVVTGCKYMYRRRSAGEVSLIQSSKTKRGWYFDYFTYLVDWAIEFYQEKFGFLPAFLQYELLCDLQWRFGQVYDMSEVLTEEEIEQYKKRLFESLRHFDDRYILEQYMIWDEHKWYMLSKKYGRLPTLIERQSNVIVSFGNTKLKSFADQYSKIEFIQLENGILTIEGFSKVFGVQVSTRIDPYLKVNDELIPCETLERESINEYRFEELIFRGISFRASVPLDITCEEYRIQFVLKYGVSEVVRRDIRYGRFSPVSNVYRNAYYYQDGWAFQVKGNAIRISRCGRKGLFQKERDFLKELRNSPRESDQKAAKARIAYHILKRMVKKPIWLVSDRINKADDNGEAFFRYLNEHHAKEIDSYFVISKDNPDFERMSKIGKVVDHLSFKHKLLYLLCEANISSQADYITDNPFQGFLNPYRDIMVKHRFVFLQHGVTKDDISGWVNRYNKNISCFVTAARPEWESIVNGTYFYPSKNIALTGFPRFDRLYHNEQKRITLMPTWRKYLADGLNAGTGIWIFGEKFFKSSYYQFYCDLLSHPRLLAAAREQGYKICFMPHPTIQPHLKLFHLPKEITVCGIDTSYRDIYAQSNLVVTDFSSAVFDFAYLRKPVLYTHFDKEEFFKGEHVYTQGYFDYERDGFGEVEYNLESTVDRLVEYMENGCQLKDKYRKRIDNFFAFNDKNNCQRVYEMIRRDI